MFHRTNVFTTAISKHTHTHPLRSYTRLFFFINRENNRSCYLPDECAVGIKDRAKVRWEAQVFWIPNQKVWWYTKDVMLKRATTQQHHHHHQRKKPEFRVKNKKTNGKLRHFILHRRDNAFVVIVSTIESNHSAY